MGHTDDFDQTTKTTPMYICPVCNKEHSSETFLIPGVGHACSKECYDAFYKSKAEELAANQAEAAKESVTETINDEILPAIRMASEMLKTEEVQTVIQEAMPLVQEVAKQYSSIIGAMLPELARPIAVMKAQAVAELKAYGFTREEAIKLMSK